MKGVDSARPIHFYLDQASLNLQNALIGDIQPEARPVAQGILKVLEELKNPYVTPLEAQLANLMEATKLVGFEIPCFKCQAAWFQDIVRGIQIRWHLERGERRKAVILWLKKGFWGRYWTLRAVPTLLKKHEPAATIPHATLSTNDLLFRSA